MADQSEEGTSFETAFVSTFGSRTNVEARLKAERRAGLTPKQRSARKTADPRSVQVNVRATVRTKALLDALADKLNCSAGDVFEKALQALAKANGVAGGQS